MSGQVAVVTGAGGGIGSAVAALLAASGIHVVVTDIDLEAAARVADAVGRADGSATCHQVDVTDAAAVDALVRDVRAQHESIDILVNVAGFPMDARITDQTDAAWARVLSVCLTGTFMTARSCAPAMIEQQYGRIINISSRAYLGNPGQANYSAAKAGVVGLTRSLAKELGRHWVTVNAIAPGLVATEAIKAHPRFEMIERRALRENVIPRLGEPADVAQAVRFLASPSAGFITGDVLHVTGGRFG